MTTELELRAEIDNETVKGLLLINGGGAIALLAFLPHVIGVAGQEILARAILWALLVYQAGLVSAVIHNHLRRKCSLAFQSHGYRPPPCKVLGLDLGTPCICFLSISFMWGSVLSFVLAGILVCIAGLKVLGA